MIRSKLRIALISGIALPSLMAGMAQAQEVKGLLGEFRFGTAAVPAPNFSQSEGEVLGTLSGRAETINIQASNSSWPYPDQSAALSFSMESGALPPGATLTPNGALEIQPFAADGTTYEFSVRAANSLGISAARTFQLASSQPEALDASNILPKAIRSSLGRYIPVASLYDADATSVTVSAGETLTIEFAEAVSADTAELFFAGATTGVSYDFVRSDNSVGGAGFLPADSGSTANFGSAASKMFRFTFSGPATLTDLRIGGAPALAAPIDVRHVASTTSGSGVTQTPPGGDPNSILTDGTNTTFFMIPKTKYVSQTYPDGIRFDRIDLSKEGGAGKLQIKSTTGQFIDVALPANYSGVYELGKTYTTTEIRYLNSGNYNNWLYQMQPIGIDETDKIYPAVSDLPQPKVGVYNQGTQVPVGLQYVNTIPFDEDPGTYFSLGGASYVYLMFDAEVAFDRVRLNAGKGSIQIQDETMGTFETIWTMPEYAYDGIVTLDKTYVGSRIVFRPASSGTKLREFSVSGPTE